MVGSCRRSSRAPRSRSWRRGTRSPSRGSSRAGPRRWLRHERMVGGTESAGSVTRDESAYRCVGRAGSHRPVRHAAPRRSTRSRERCRRLDRDGLARAPQADLVAAGHSRARRPRHRGARLPAQPLWAARWPAATMRPLAIVFPDLSGPYYSAVILGYEEASAAEGQSVLILATHGRHGIGGPGPRPRRSGRRPRPVRVARSTTTSSRSSTAARPGRAPGSRADRSAGADSVRAENRSRRPGR